MRKDGTRFWAEVVITALRDEHGQPRGFAKITRDLTERKRAEDLLEQRVQERTAELTAANLAIIQTIQELEQFHDAVVGRELRMMELEKENAALQETLRRYEAKRNRGT